MGTSISEAANQDCYLARDTSGSTAGFVVALPSYLAFFRLHAYAILGTRQRVMYARLVTGQIIPHRLDEAVRLLKKSVAPSVKRQKGLRSAQLLVNRKLGKVTSIGL
jgi:hypothetical protein